MMYSTVHAVNQAGAVFGTQMDFWEFILLAISLFVLSAGLLSILFILWWGLLLILSGWKDDKIKPAINTIRYAVIGVVVTVLTIFLFPILGRLLWLDVEKYAKPQRIFQKIEEIWNTIFWNNDTTLQYTSPNPSNSLDDFPADFSDL
jgi:uncharacterized membrane protein YgaE (UPF0421/DUF939 family)